MSDKPFYYKGVDINKSKQYDAEIAINNIHRLNSIQGWGVSSHFERLYSLTILSIIGARNRVPGVTMMQARQKQPDKAGADPAQARPVEDMTAPEAAHEPQRGTCQGIEIVKRYTRTEFSAL